MSIFGAAGRLWANAPIWRWTAIGATALTVFAAGSLLMGNFGSNPPPAPRQANSSQPAPAASTATAPSAACAATPSSAAAPPPGNVVMVTPSGPSRASTNRVAAFELATLAADSEQRLGERCVMLVGAFEALEQEDTALITCNPDTMRRHAEASRCVGEVALSDTRFAALRKAFDTYAGDRSARAVFALAQSVSALGSFDRSRQVWQEMQTAIESGAAAAQQIAASDQRIADLAAAAKAAKDAPTGGALDLFGSAAQQITSFDRERLSDLQATELADGLEAAERAAASSERLENLTAALALAEADESAATSDRLIDAVVALDDFDLERATAEQRASIETAKATALARAQARLVNASEGVDPANAAPEQLAMLANLRALVADNGGLPADPDPAVSEAYALGGQAAAILADSDRRIAAMATALQTWRANPGARQEGALIDVHASISPFDQARLTAEQREQFAELGAARDIIAAMTTGLGPSTRDAVSVYVAPVGSDAEARAVADALRNQLIGRGYDVADLRENAALTIEVTWGGERLQQLTIGSSQVETSTATASIVVSWTHRNEVQLRETARGEGRGFNGTDVTGQAIENVASELADSFDAAFEG